MFFIVAIFDAIFILDSYVRADVSKLNWIN